MSRPLRIQFPGAVYHVMNRGAARQATFIGAGDYQALLDTLAEAHQLWALEVFGYFLLGNHYYLCLRTPKGNLSRLMRHVDGIYTQRFNRRHRRNGPLFWGRYKAILVDGDEYLAAVVRYIHLKAVEAAIVKMPEGYGWASHRYDLLAKGVPSWLNTAEALGQIGGRRAFHEFVLSGNEESLTKYYEARRQSPILGGEGFIERARQPSEAVARGYARYERRVVRVGPDRIIDEVIRRYKVRREEIFQGKRGRENEARMVAMYLCRQMGGHRHEEIGKAVGLGKASSVSSAYLLMEARVAKEKRLGRRVRRIEASLPNS